MGLAPPARSVSDPDYMPGFRSLDRELADYRLPVEGSIPSWLSGTLVRNGPGKFEVGGERVTHWFDGFAMLRRYAFEDGEVRYTNRFLRSEAYADAMAGEASGQFATDETGLQKVRSWLRRLGPPEPTDNANVHVARLDGDPVALTEVPRWSRFDLDSLETGGEFAFDDDLSIHMTTAHLVRDPHRGEHVGYGLRFGRTHEYRVFSIPDGTGRRDLIADIETDQPAYIHSCAVTPDHVVLPETPLRIAILRALSPFSEGFFDMLEWDPDRGTRLLVVDRESGDLVAEPTVDPVFTLHTANAFADGEDIVVDLVDYEDSTIVDALALDELETAGFPDVPSGRLARYRITPDGDVSRERLYGGGMEMPVVARPRRTRRHRYVYGQTTDREGANGLVKVDTERGTATEWWEQSVYVEEPRVVQHPDADSAPDSSERANGGKRVVTTSEDEGVVLAPALDAEAERAMLLVFDAATLTERARAPLPHHHPFGFHGRYFRGA